MPYVAVTVHAPAVAPEACDTLHGGLTDLMANVLGKDRRLTAVSVDVRAASWTVGGVAVAPAAHVAAHITAGTNTAEEKAAFIAQAAALLRDCLGALPEATYVVITEIAADAWGYDGQTQAARRGPSTPPPYTPQ